MPFGFSNSDDDPDRDKNAAGGNPFGGGDMPFGFGAGGEGFDPAQLGQMLTQFGQMLSGMGSSMGQGGSSGPVNYDIAKKLARQQIGSVTPITEGNVKAIADARAPGRDVAGRRDNAPCRSEPHSCVDSERLARQHDRHVEATL